MQNVVTPQDIQILLNFQRARYAMFPFNANKEIITRYFEARQALKNIKQPHLAALVGKMMPKSHDVPTTEEESAAVAKEVEEMGAAEDELYRISFYFGDAIPHEGATQ